MHTSIRDQFSVQYLLGTLKTIRRLALHKTLDQFNEPCILITSSQGSGSYTHINGQFLGLICQMKGSRVAGADL